jgi:ABC-type Fe3+-hydroxamate transport system substrate-binding protein
MSPKHSFIDDLHHEILLDSLPNRIISLVPSITQTICDLGCANKLVGRTKFCIEPEAVLEHVPIVGGTKKVDIEKILALRPDIVLCNKEENTTEIYDALINKVPVWVSDVITLEDNYRMITQLGALTGASETAIEINGAIQSGMDKARAIMADNKALYLIWKDPYMTVGNDTFIHHILQYLGFINVAGKKKRYPAFEPRDHEFKRPDYVLLSSEPYPFNQKHVAEWELVYPKSKVLTVDGAYFSWYGSKMLGASDYFQQTFQFQNQSK